MDITDDDLRRIQRTVDAAKVRYENRMKAERSMKKAAFDKKRKELGIKVIRGGNIPSQEEGGR